jgi:DNA (cytosine-5)-methyltransferase 1
LKPLTITKQLSLLQQSIREDVDLADILEDEGYSYEDLRYRHNSKRPESRVRYLTVDELQATPIDIPAISFFAGAGGLDLGFEAAGFQHMASFEFNATFCKTLLHNRPNWHVFNEDLSQRDRIVSILSDRLSIRAPFDGVFHGGPPCQSFSIAANQRFSKNGGNFKRVGFAHEHYGTLLFDYIAYIRQFRPRAFLLENVPGLEDVDGGGQLTEALAMLAGDGYTISKPTILNAVNYQIPQDRKRLFVVGFRDDARAIELPLGGSPPVPCYKAFERPMAADDNHIVRNHRADSVLRYMELRYGQREKLGRVDRLDPRLPSKTVIAGGTGGGGRSHLHPDVPRTLSPREAARLQTFPDSFIFTGPPARQLTQVGNAVPPVMGWHLAKCILHRLGGGAPMEAAPKRKRKPAPKEPTKSAALPFVTCA